MPQLDPRQLFRQLRPAVLDGSATDAARRPSGEPSGPSFDRLLAQVAYVPFAGEAAAGPGSRPVTCDCTLDKELQPHELDRLAQAGDAAEAAGGQRTLMLIGGRALVMDVPARRIEGELTTGSGSMHVERIDAAMSIDAPSSSNAQAAHRLTLNAIPPDAIPPEAIPPEAIPPGAIPPESGVSRSHDDNEAQKHDTNARSARRLHIDNAGAA